MQEWWEALSIFEKVFWYIAVPFSVILIIQIVLTFVGIGGGSSDIGEGLTDVSGLDLDTDIDVTDVDSGTFDQHDVSSIGDAASMLNVFTLRNFIAFFTVFGWGGIAGIHANMSTVWTIVFALALGIATMFIISALFYFISKLVDSGTMDIRNALNQVGNVYIPIKAKSGNIGKIQVNIQDSLREMRAITKKGQDLPTGTVVKVTGLISGNILVVEKLSN